MSGPSEASFPYTSYMFGVETAAVRGDQTHDVNWAPPPAGDPHRCVGTLGNNGQVRGR